jgi:hypothetical protein
MSWQDHIALEKRLKRSKSRKMWFVKYKPYVVVLLVLTTALAIVSFI